MLHRHVAAHESAAVDVVSSRYAIGATASESRSMLSSVCRADFPNSRSPKCRNTVPNNLPLGPRPNSRIHHISTRLPSGVGVAAIFQPGTAMDDIAKFIRANVKPHGVPAAG